MARLNYEQKLQLFNLIDMQRMGLLRGYNSEAIAKKLDNLKVPWRIQNRAAYLAETTTKYANDIIKGL